MVLQPDRPKHATSAAGRYQRPSLAGLPIDEAEGDMGRAHPETAGKSGGSFPESAGRVQTSSRGIGSSGAGMRLRGLSRAVSITTLG
jgi:hypothetical protein